MRKTIVMLGLGLLASASVFAGEGQKQSTDSTFHVCLVVGCRQPDWAKDVLDAPSVKAAKEIAERHRCSVRVEQDRYVFVVHEPSLGLTAVKAKLAAVEELLKSNTGPFQVLDPAKLSGDTYGFLLSQHADTPGFKGAYEQGDAKLFLSPSVDFLLTNGGKSVSVRWRPQDPADGAEYLTTSKPSANATRKRALPDDPEVAWEGGLGIDQLTVSLSKRPLSAARKADLASSAFKQIADEFEGENRKLKDLSASLLAGLMRSYLDSVWSGTLNDGATGGSFDSLSAKGKEELIAQITGDFAAYGFSSEDEALNFVRGSSIRGAKFGLSVSFRMGNVQTDAGLGLR